MSVVQLPVVIRAQKDQIFGVVHLSNRCGFRERTDASDMTHFNAQGVPANSAELRSFFFVHHFLGVFAYLLEGVATLSFGSPILDGFLLNPRQMPRTLFFAVARPTLTGSVP